MDDIIASVPHPRSDGHFWLEHFWAYGDGTFSSCDTDGNHDPCEGSDVPTGNAYDKAWRDYFQHVARTGCDCIHEFMNPRKSRNVVWQVRFFDSILGVRVQARRRGRGVWLDAFSLPPFIRDFLCVVPFDAKHPGSSLVIDRKEFPSVAALRERAKELNWQRTRYPQATFTVKEPPRETPVRELKARAREALRKRK